MGAQRSSRKTAVRERRSAVERSILEATEHLLVEADLRDLTIDDVMAETGLSRTAFYRFFPDLEAVLLRWFAELVEEIAGSAELWNEEAADPATGLDETVIGLARLFRDHGGVLLACSNPGSGPEMEQAWERFVEGRVEVATARIEGLQARGICDVKDARQTARALMYMTEGYLLRTLRAES